MNKLAEGLLWYIAFLFSTTLHEAFHALVVRMRRTSSQFFVVIRVS